MLKLAEIAGHSKSLLNQFVAVVGLSSVFLAPSQDAAARDLHANPPQPIHEEMFVPIGDIEQWITITGDDRNNPVVLFLHGGPGAAASQVADAMFAGWEKDFTLVQWDQRGAGRTYGKNDPHAIEPTMTIERMTQDGIEVSEYLLKHLGKKKIILLGISWGSILGIMMAHAHPDLFYADVGMAQIVNDRKNVAASYARVLELATAANDHTAVAELTAIGAPPWASPRSLPTFRKWRGTYQAKLITAPPADVTTISPEYASAQERAQYDAAYTFSVNRFAGTASDDPEMKIDLPALGTNFAIPVFMIQGEQDLTAVPELAKAYFDSIKAPKKQFYLVPGTGHYPSVPSMALTRKVLVEQVRPEALEH